jgi:hypothetical protein
MLDEKIAFSSTNGHADLLEIRRANWLLASATAQQTGNDWDLDETPFEFLCECERASCTATVELRLALYVEAASRRHLVVSPGHQSALDAIKNRTDGYLEIQRDEHDLQLAS